jgi:hypothetical protein
MEHAIRTAGLWCRSVALGVESEVELWSFCSQQGQGQGQGRGQGQGQGQGRPLGHGLTSRQERFIVLQEQLCFQRFAGLLAHRSR